MKQIEVFVDKVYQGVGGNEKEIKDLKTEMKNHLLEAVYELKKEGKSEQEAIEILLIDLVEKKKCVLLSVNCFRHKKHLLKECFI
ncbi:permease prefix domain 1-containing protein [Peribacillus frigoritolerans]|uniref:permease prefix domain 1-containing protein n=1 Tax=Peribacillus frigoritolerans TaxID=450367 RepID=UPI00345D8EBD